MKVIATIKKVGDLTNSRPYESQYGNGYAVPVQIGTEMGEAVFEVFGQTVEKAIENAAKKGIVPGAIGHVDATCSYRSYTDKEGNVRYSNSLNVSSRSWELANQHIKQEPEQKAEQKPVPMEKTAEMVAAAEQKVQEAQNDPEAGKDLPF